MKKIIAFSLAALAALSLSAQSGRVLFDEGWQFALGDASSPEKDFGCGTEYFNYLTKANSIHNEGPYSLSFDASSWQNVNLPHDWVVDLPFAAEASHSHGYKTVGYRYPETSVGWYRKTFTVPEEDAGKRVYIRFDGIFRDSRIWVNGFYVGHEPSGYATRVYDITEYLNFGGENLVCVRADATLEEGWFYEGAGIYRHVWLSTVSPVHVAPFGTAVVSDLAEDFSSATLNIATTVRNASYERAECKLEHILYDASGGEVTRSGQYKISVLFEPMDEFTDRQVLELTDPHLWSVNDPYLYKLVTEVWTDGSLSDSYTTTIGVRSIAFDSNRGFLLNGEPLKLKGVNMHQDHAGVGSGIPDALQLWRLRQLKAFGCNAYRASHNPMTPETLDACDSLGILVIEENRLTGVNEEHHRLLSRMIERDRNHPCIILWSVGNEEWGIEWDERGERIVATMREWCHLLDPSRPMTVATSGGPNIVIPADVAGYNYILQNPVEQHRSDYPSRRAVGSEETSGCGTRGIYFDDDSCFVPIIDGFRNSDTGAPLGKGRMTAHNRHPQGPDSLLNCIERGWKFYSERPWLGGLFYWTGFDYRGEPNPLEFPATGSEFGILDYCGFPKDEAFYLKAWWTDEPVLHILPHWNLTGHEGEQVSVWVYSNCDEVTLYVNGKNLGRKAMPQGGHLEWTATYEPGSIKAVGYKGGKKQLETVVETAGEPARIVLSCDKAFLSGSTSHPTSASSSEDTDNPSSPPATSPNSLSSPSLGASTPLSADGRDVAVVAVEIQDSKGRFVPDACNELTLSVSGSVRILGVGNGDPAWGAPERPASTSYGDTFTLSTFNGLAQILLQSTGESGSATLTVSSPGLATAIYSINTK